MMRNAKMTGLALGALVLGRGWIGPPPLSAMETALPETIRGVPKTGGMNVLVVYASRCGSTAGVAERIGQTLSMRGHASRVIPVEEVKDIDPYDAVIAGSAIRTGKWLPEVVDFVGTHQDALSRKPVAYFQTCLTVCRAAEESLTKARSFFDPLLERFPEGRPVSLGVFAGVLDYTKLSWPIRAVMRSKMKDQGVAEGDYRDWVAIEMWARGVSRILEAKVGGREEEI